MFSVAKLPKKVKNRFPAVNFFPSESAAARVSAVGFRRRCEAPAARASENRFRDSTGSGNDAGLRRCGFRRLGFSGPVSGRHRFRRRCGVPAAQALPGLNLRVQSYAGPARCRCRSRFRKLSRTKTKHPGNLPGCLCPCCRRLFRAAGAACSVVPYLAARMLFSA